MPVYNWQNLTDAINACAGKMISLRIGTGGGGRKESKGNVPDWVMTAVKNAGGKTFRFIDTSSGGIIREIPVFWNPIFMAKKRQLMQDLGNKYPATNINVVFVGFANSQSVDWSVPDSSAPDGLDPTDPDSSEVSRWRDVQYETQKVIDAGCAAGNSQGIIDAAAAAFPNSAIVFAGGTTRAVLDPAVRYATEMAFANATAKAFGGRVGIIKADLSEKTSESQPYSGTTTEYAWRILADQKASKTGAQMLSPATNLDRFFTPNFAAANPANPANMAKALEAAVDCGGHKRNFELPGYVKGYGTQFQEIYQSDCISTDAAMQQAIQHAHNLLTQEQMPICSRITRTSSSTIYYHRTAALGTLTS